MIISLATPQKLKKTNPASHRNYKIQHKITHNPNVSFLEHKRNNTLWHVLTSLPWVIIFYFHFQRSGAMQVQLRCQMFSFPTHGANH